MIFRLRNLNKLYGRVNTWTRFCNKSRNAHHILSHFLSSHPTCPTFRRIIGSWSQVPKFLPAVISYRVLRPVFLVVMNNFRDYLRKLDTNWWKYVDWHTCPPPVIINTYVCVIDWRQKVKRALYTSIVIRS